MVLSNGCRVNVGGRGFCHSSGFVLIDSYVGGKMNLDLGDVCLFHKLWALCYSIGRGNEDDGGQEGQRMMLLHSLDRSVIQ